jgi:hypothetical protein
MYPAWLCVSLGRKVGVDIVTSVYQAAAGTDDLELDAVASLDLALNRSVCRQLHPSRSSDGSAVRSGAAPNENR